MWLSLEELRCPEPHSSGVLSRQDLIYSSQHLYEVGTTSVLYCLDKEPEFQGRDHGHALGQCQSQNSVSPLSTTVCTASVLSLVYP